VPVLILSATPYRALTLGHELAEGALSHHEDFFTTLGFLFGTDTITPARIRAKFARFGELLRKPEHTDQLHSEITELKRALEEDLTRVICRTERKRYVLDNRGGVDEDVIGNGVLPGKEELQEFFSLHNALAYCGSTAQLTEFWKSAPSLLTFLDGHYQLFKALGADNIKVPRALVTAPTEVKALATRNHRISRVIELSLGEDDKSPCLWTAPTYSYYWDDYFGTSPPHKRLVFSGWRFVPKTVAIVTSHVAVDRLGGETEDASQPIRFTERSSFHVFDLCYP